MNELKFEEIRRYCRSREVDLVLTGSSAPFALELHGQFDDEGDFFTILIGEIEYVELPAFITVGDMELIEDMSRLTRYGPRWSRVEGDCSGPALVLRSADSDDWGDERYSFVVIANRLEWRAGRDWVYEGS